LELVNMAQNGDLHNMWAVARQTNLTFNLVRSWVCCFACNGQIVGLQLTTGVCVKCLQVTFVLSCLLLVFAVATYIFTRSRPVYLLNFHCFKPPAQ
jgi:hypothetical protein